MADITRRISVKYMKNILQKFILSSNIHATSPGSTEGLREYLDVIEISVEYYNILNREHSSILLSSLLNQSTRWEMGISIE